MGGVVVRFAHRLSIALGMLAGVCVVALMVATVADVVKRQTVGQGIAGVIEASSLVLPVVAFLGMGYAQRTGAHVATTLFMGMLPARPAATIRALALTLAWAILAWALVVTAQEAYDSYRISEYELGLIHLPVWPAKLAIPLGLAVLLIEMAITIVGLIQVAAGRQTAPADDPTHEGVTL